MSGRLALATLLLAAACGGTLRSPPAAEEDETTRLVGRADELAQDGRPREARAVYDQVLRQHPAEPVAARALYGLAMLRVEPGPLQDYRAARVAFDRLAAEHPRSPWARDAAAWGAVLKELERSQADRVKLQRDLDQLKELDLGEERQQ